MINVNCIDIWIYKLLLTYLLHNYLIMKCIQFNALFQTQCFYTLSVHNDTYNENILITKKGNPTNNYIIIILILTKIVKKLDSAIVKWT